MSPTRNCVSLCVSFKAIRPAISAAHAHPDRALGALARIIHEFQGRKRGSRCSPGLRRFSLLSENDYVSFALFRLALRIRICRASFREGGAPSPDNFKVTGEDRRPCAKCCATVRYNCRLWGSPAPCPLSFSHSKAYFTKPIRPAFCVRNETNRCATGHEGNCTMNRESVQPNRLFRSRTDT
jgi:hypothetical protein